MYTILLKVQIHLFRFIFLFNLKKEDLFCNVSTSSHVYIMKSFSKTEYSPLTVKEIMKRIIILIATFIATHLAFAQTAKEIYQKYQQTEGSKIAVEINGFESFNKVHILNLNQCSSQIKTNLFKDVDQLKNNGYHLVISVNGNNESTRIITRSEKATIKEVLIANLDKECSLILIDCNLDLNNLDSIIKTLPNLLNGKIEVKAKNKETRKSERSLVILG